MASHAAADETNARPSVSLARENWVTSRTSAALQIGASLLWIPQAAFIAIAVGAIADGNAVTWPAFVVLAIGILKAIVEGIGSRLAFHVGREAATRLRDDAVVALASRSPLDSDRTLSGQAASVIAEQAEMIVPYVARFEIAKMRAVVVPVILFVFILSQSWVAGLVLLMAAPLIPIFMVLIGWRAKEASEAHLAKTGDMNAFLLDRLRGITTIRALDAVDTTAQRIRADAESLRMRTMAVLRIAFLSSAVLELFSALGVAMVAVYIGFHLLGQLNFGTWGAPLDLTEGLFVLLLAPAFFEPLRDLSSVWHDRASGQAAIKSLENLALSGRSVVGSNPDASRPAEPLRSAPAIVIERLSLRHPQAGEPVLSDFELSISAGEHIALVGPSGSGKSTLLALVAGLLSATSGSICIGGRPLDARTAANIRDGIAWIGQRPHIFPGSVRSNIILGRHIDHDDIVRSLQFAKLDGLEQLRGLNDIGENGLGLSGGEALRVAIARVAAQPQRVLILADEPTAHLDSATAKIIADRLFALAQGKTMIVATHDMALARQMNRIVRLHEQGWEEAA